MMKKLTLAVGLVAASGLVFGLPGYALTNSAPHSYPSGVKVAVQIGSDLYDSLDAKYRKKLEAQPIRTVAVDEPELAFIETNDENKVLCQVSVSAGFVDLINHIAHAKAIDRMQPGFFAKYISSFGSANGDQTAALDIGEDRYWTDDVMNDQSSYFNQMMGMTMAINLSHYYLGQFSKHADQMRTGKLVPINNFLTSNEWEKGVRAGAVNSLNCAFATEGAKALFEAIDKMQRRPAWAAYIVPQNIDIKKLNKQLAKYEVDFFHGGLN